jgi:uracil-DNA glycosylase
MPWSERQRAMLGRIGLRIWQPAAVPGAATAAGMAPVAVVVPVAVPVAAPAPMAPKVAAAVPVPAPIAPSASSAAARPDAATIAQLAWPALREAVAGCRACGLCETRTRTVFGVGHERAQWLIVGEAPGAEEDRQGEPFVGAAGQLLDRMLAALNLTRSAEPDPMRPPERRAYIANTLKCRPPGNRNPTAEELARCEPFLRRQIALLQPRLVLAMGRFAVQTLLQSDEAIGRLRGRVHRWQGLPLVVTYHPAYLLRNPADKAKAWDDLLLAASTLSREPPARDPQARPGAADDLGL